MKLHPATMALAWALQQPWPWPLPCVSNIGLSLLECLLLLQCCHFDAVGITIDGVMVFLIFCDTCTLSTWPSHQC